MSSLQRRVDRLENAARPEPEDETERQKRLEDVRRVAEEDNERFFRCLAIERRTSYLESVGYKGHAAEDLRDENFIYSTDEPPFTITDDGEAFSSRDGRLITSYRQEHAEL